MNINTCNYSIQVDSKNNLAVVSSIDTKFNVRLAKIKTRQHVYMNMKEVGIERPEQDFQIKVDYVDMKVFQHHIASTQTLITVRFWVFKYELDIISDLEKVPAST